MKMLKNKSEITVKNLKNQDCDYKGFRLGFDKEDNVYYRGDWFSSIRSDFETINDLKFTF